MKKTMLLAAALLLLAAPTLAQDVVSQVPANWWSELVAAVTSALEPIAIAVLTALGGYVLTRVSSWLTGKISDQARNRIISGAEIAGRVALMQLISSARDGKITLMEVMTAVRAGATELMKTYSTSAAKLDMTQANAERVVKDGIMQAAAAQGLSVDLTQAGTIITLPPAAAAVPAPAPATVVPGPGVMRSHPVATGMAFAAALAVVFMLVGCGPAQTPTQPGDTSGITRNIAYAEGYVAVAKAAATTCIVLRLPVCSSPAFVAGVEKATAVADEAIAEAKAYPINGSTADKINAALRVAMNAVLLFNSLR